MCGLGQSSAKPVTSVSGNLSKPGFQEQLNVTVHWRDSNLMKLENIHMRLKRTQTESRVNSGLRPASDEEFDERDLVHIAGKHREKRGRRFRILTLIEGINDDENRNLRHLERTNDEFLHLGTKGLLSKIRARPQGNKQLISEARRPMSELKGQGRKNDPEVAPPLEIPRTEKARPELPISKAPLRERLGDGRLPSPGETPKPKHAFVLFIV